MEFPHLLRLIEREPVRHDLPRALLLLLVHDRAAGVRARTACGCSTSRSCRPTAARCASTAATPTTRAKPDTERARELLAARATRRATRPLDDLPRLRRAGARRTSARSARVPDRRSSARASGSSATARRRRATRCSTTAASARDFLDYTVDLNPHKQGHLPAGHAHPDPRARRDPRDAAGRRVHPALEPARTRSWSSSPSSATGAAGSLVRTPELRVYD